MKVFELSFIFKGDRNYVQGTNIYTELIKLFRKENLGEIKSIRFNKLLKTNAFLEIYSKNDTINKSEAYAEGNFTDINGDRCCFSISPNLDSEIDDRSDFDEDLIFSQIFVNEKSAFLKKLTGFTFIEEIIAITKYLNNTLCPVKSGKWVFTKLVSFESLPKERNVGNEIKIFQKQLIAKRFSKNQVYLGPNLIALLEFCVL